MTSVKCLHIVGIDHLTFGMTPQQVNAASRDDTHRYIKAFASRTTFFLLPYHTLILKPTIKRINTRSSTLSIKEINLAQAKSSQLTGSYLLKLLSHWKTNLTIPNSRYVRCPKTASLWKPIRWPPQPRRWHGRRTTWHAESLARLLSQWRYRKR